MAGVQRPVAFAHARRTFLEREIRIDAEVPVLESHDAKTALSGGGLDRQDAVLAVLSLQFIAIARPFSYIGSGALDCILNQIGAATHVQR